MAKNDGLGLDFLNQIINVQWEGGELAVEFGDHAEDAPRPTETETA